MFYVEVVTHCNSSHLKKKKKKEIGSRLPFPGRTSDFQEQITGGKREMTLFNAAVNLNHSVLGNRRNLNPRFIEASSCSLLLANGINKPLGCL